jgi:hypothetical protein
MEQWRLTLFSVVSPWRLILYVVKASHPGVTQVPLELRRFPWNHAGSPGVMQVPLELRRFPWSHTGSPGVTEAHFGLAEAHMILTPEFTLTL